MENLTDFENREACSIAGVKARTGFSFHREKGKKLADKPPNTITIF